MSGESEAKIRQLFQEAAASAPCIVFIGKQQPRGRCVGWGGGWGGVGCCCAAPGAGRQQHREAVGGGTRAQQVWQTRVQCVQSASRRCPSPSPMQLDGARAGASMRFAWSGQPTRCACGGGGSAGAGRWHKHGAAASDVKRSGRGWRQCAQTRRRRRWSRRGLQGVGGGTVSRTTHKHTACASMPTHPTRAPTHATHLSRQNRSLPSDRSAGTRWAGPRSRGAAPRPAVQTQARRPASCSRPVCVCVGSAVGGAVCALKTCQGSSVTPAPHSQATHARTARHTHTARHPQPTSTCISST